MVHVIVLLCFRRALRENLSYPHIGGVDLDDELEFRLGQGEDGSGGEPLLQTLNASPA